MTTETYANLVREKFEGRIDHYIALTHFNSSSEPRRERLGIPETAYAELRKGFEDAVAGKKNLLRINEVVYEDPVVRGEIIDVIGNFLEVQLETQ